MTFASILKVVGAVKGVASKIPVAVYVAGAAVGAIVVYGKVEHSRGYSAARADDTAAAHKKLDATIDSILRVDAARQVKVDTEYRDSIVALGVTEDSAGKLRHLIWQLLSKPQPNSTPARDSQQKAVSAACGALVVQDSLLSQRAGETGSLCEQRVASRDSTIRDLKHKDSIDANRPLPALPRFMLRGGVGYAAVWDSAALVGRWSTRLVADARLFGPFTVSGNADITAGVKHPFEAKAFLMYRF